jgi:hypothetical protein
MLRTYKYFKAGPLSFAKCETPANPETFANNKLIRKNLTLK